MISSLLLAAIFHYIQIPVAEMREKPCQESEIVSQAIFSEQVEVFEEENDWVKIETAVDKYHGWVRKDALCRRITKFLDDPSAVIAKVNRCAAHLYNAQDTVNGPILTLPFESRLEVIDPKEVSETRWIKVLLPNGSAGFIQRGDVEINPRLITRDEMCALSLRFLDLPYTWGGRSSFGYDCSGLVQMLYRQMGIALPAIPKIKPNGSGSLLFPLKICSPGI